MSQENYTMREGEFIPFSLFQFKMVNGEIYDVYTRNPAEDLGIRARVEAQNKWLKTKHKGEDVCINLSNVVSYTYSEI